METQQAFTPTVLSESGPIKNYKISASHVVVYQSLADAINDPSKENATIIIQGAEPGPYQYCRVTLIVENDPESSDPIEILNTSAIVGINSNAFDSENSIAIPSSEILNVNINFNPELGTEFEIQLSAPDSEFNSISIHWENS